MIASCVCFFSYDTNAALSLEQSSGYPARMNACAPSKKKTGWAFLFSPDPDGKSSPESSRWRLIAATSLFRKCLVSCCLSVLHMEYSTVQYSAVQYSTLLCSQRRLCTWPTCARFTCNDEELNSIKSSEAGPGTRLC
jgi:hypothetical protein